MHSFLIKQFAFATIYFFLFRKYFDILKLYTVIADPNKIRHVKLWRRTFILCR